uniref:Uncharacterized protein n=1 Tax=Octopus bimaculoides TaxID=37653 RepID=A0A0L8GX59_OCTBM
MCLLMTNLYSSLAVILSMEPVMNPRAQSKRIIAAAAGDNSNLPVLFFLAHPEMSETFYFFLSSM